MAYGVKYRLEYEDQLGRATRIDILKDGYSSSVIEVTGTGKPLQWGWPRGDKNNILDPIKGSQASINLWSITDFQFIEFLQAADRDYKVEIYKDPGWIDPLAGDVLADNLFSNWLTANTLRDWTVTNNDASNYITEDSDGGVKFTRVSTALEISFTLPSANQYYEHYYEIDINITTGSIWLEIGTQTIKFTSSGKYSGFVWVNSSLTAKLKADTSGNVDVVVTRIHLARSRNLLRNGDFYKWTGSGPSGDSPDYWTEDEDGYPDEYITEDSANANFYSNNGLATAALYQSILTSGEDFKAEIGVDDIVSGQVDYGGGSSMPSHTTSGIKLFEFTANSSIFRIEASTGAEDEFIISEARIREKWMLMWTGWVEPGVYNEDYKPPPYKITIKANDGLGSLKLFDYDNDGDLYSGINRMLYVGSLGVINIILDKISLELGIYSGINKYEDSHNTTDSDDPLYQTYVNMKGVADNKLKPQTCHQVLTRAMRVMGARIYQAWGYWHMVEIRESVKPYDRRLYDSTGAYQSNDRFLPLKPLGKLSDEEDYRNVLVRARGVLGATRPAGTIVIVQDFGKMDNGLINGNFDRSPPWTIAPEFWSAIGSVDIEQHEDGVKFPTSDTAIDTAKYLKSDTIWVVGSTDTNIRLIIIFKLSNASANGYYMLYANTGLGSRYYNASTGAWSATITRNTLNPSKADTFENEELETVAIPSGYNFIQLLIYQPVYASSVEMIVKSAELNIVTNDGTSIPDEEISEYDCVNDSDIKLKDIEIDLGDRPSGVNNSQAIYTGILQTSLQSPTSAWVTKGGLYNYAAKGILQLLGYFMAKQKQNHNNVLQGIIRGRLDFMTSLVEERLGGGMMITGGVIDDKACELDGEWVELHQDLVDSTTSPPATTTTAGPTTTVARTIVSSGSLSLHSPSDSDSVTVNVTPDSMNTSLSKVDTGDGTGWFKISSGTSEAGDFTLTVISFGTLPVGPVSANVRIDDDSSAVYELVSVSRVDPT